MNWADLFANLPLLLSAVVALAGALQACLAPRLALRLFGLAALFLGTALVFAVSARPGSAGPASDPAGQAAAIAMLLLALAVLGVGVALAMRLGERFGGLGDAAATADADEAG